MSKTVIALDVGTKRIGVARANTIARLPEPLSTLLVSPTIYQDIVDVVRQLDAAEIVVGLPRDVHGGETAQSAQVRAFVDQLKQICDVPVHFQDESLTSVKAEEILDQRKKGYNKSDVDALAATFILEDYLATLGDV